MPNANFSNMITFRLAIESDLPEIILLLADDELGKSRETLGASPSAEYMQAFREIQSQANNEVIVGVLDKKIVATLQTTYIPTLVLEGTKRALIEGVRVSSAFRSRGIGEKLFAFAIQRAREHGCKIVQLTTNKKRVDAQRFYLRLGFEATHEGMKLSI